MYKSLNLEIWLKFLWKSLFKDVSNLYYKVIFLAKYYFSELKQVWKKFFLVR